MLLRNFTAGLQFLLHTGVTDDSLFLFFEVEESLELSNNTKYRLSYGSCYQKSRLGTRTCRIHAWINLLTVTSTKYPCLSSSDKSSP